MQSGYVTNNEEQLAQFTSSVQLAPVHELNRALNRQLVEMKYAVRGQVVMKAGEVMRRINDGEDLGFKELIPCNIGNPQAVKQRPITFGRQVIACCACPSLMEFEGEKQTMPTDVIARAREYIADTSGNSVGCYTDSNGLKLCRKQIADFIELRDGFPCDPDSLQLTTGASESVKRVIQALITKSTDGMMVPCPQYPLYSAALTMSGGRLCYYNLDETKNWVTTREELERAYAEAQENGTELRAIVVINPGNPSGSVLSHSDVKMIICFARDKGLIVLADEVYQENVYADGKQFHSFKKVLREMQRDHPGEKGFSEERLISFHSVSKGVLGECGFRGGYMEIVGLLESSQAVLSKVACTSLSSNTMGHIMCGLMVAPPKEGDPSFALYKQERDGIFDGLKRRATMLQDGLNAIPGISCQKIEGAMYGFPKIVLPAKAVEKAKEVGCEADEYWCTRLVEETGIVCVPGSGFGQEAGTFHFPSLSFLQTTC